MREWGVVRKSRQFCPRKERNHGNGAKGCNELMPFPSDLLWLHLLALGWGPGETLVHCAGALL